MEKTPRLKPHERPRGVNPHIKEYAGKLGAGSVVGTLRDGRNIRLADPVEHGYTVDEPRRANFGSIQRFQEDAGLAISLTDGVPVPRKAVE